MPGKDLHDKPFDEETLTKLEIFESYARHWLPTFILGGNKTLCIFDFFAGPGYDVKGVPGSPIRILNEIKKQIKEIFKHQTKIHFVVNEYSKTKFAKLENACKSFLIDNPELVRAGVEIHYYNRDFELLFAEMEPVIGKYPSLVYLDQNGIKFTSDKYFLSIAQKPVTDFLYYVSSSYFRRFGKTPEFQHLIKVDVDEVRAKPYKYIHQNILNYLRGRLPQNSNVKLYPFTIKKHANVYGIIFGASHVRAVDKFLKTAWDINNVNGAANFDIDDDASKSQGVLFGDPPLTKIDSFKKVLREKILSGEIKNNQEAFIFTLEEGHIGTHAKEAISLMKKEGLITFDAKSPKVNYEAAVKNNCCVAFQIIKKP